MRAEHSYLAKFEQLRARNPWRPALKPEQIAEVKPVQHSIVRTRPKTCQKALFVSEHFTTRIVGLPDDQGRALLQTMFEHSTAQQVRGAGVSASLAAA